jgi:hypothetical protein
MFLACRTEKGLKGVGDDIRHWRDIWQQVLDYESGVNLRLQGHRVLPDAMDVRTSTSAGSA